MLKLKIYCNKTHRDVNLCGSEARMINRVKGGNGKINIQSLKTTGMKANPIC